jgi:hypothetical protein
MRLRVRVRVRTVGGLPTSEGTRLFAASALLCGFALSIAHDWLPSHAQALAQLTAIFSSVPPSAIADALHKAGGNVQQAADLLFTATQARAACTVGTSRASPPRAGQAGSVLWACARTGRTKMGTREDELA